MPAEPVARRASAADWRAGLRGLAQCLLDIACCQAQVCACGWVVDADDAAAAGRPPAPSAAPNHSARPV